MLGIIYPLRPSTAPRKHSPLIIQTRVRDDRVHGLSLYIRIFRSCLFLILQPSLEPDSDPPRTTNSLLKPLDRDRLSCSFVEIALLQ